MEERESEVFYISIITNKEKDAIDDIGDGVSLVTDNPFINEQRYLNLFKCHKNLLKSSMLHVNERAR